MKTVLLFLEGMDKRKVILKHSKDVHIFREIRPDHMRRTDADENLIKDTMYIIIRFPKTKKIDLSTFKLRPTDRLSSGFLIQEGENHVEILFYDRIIFAWYAYDLEQIGLFKVSQRIVPDFQLFGELFPCYMNARGIRQWSYNIFFGLFQLPFQLYRERAEKRKQALKQTVI